MDENPQDRSQQTADRPRRSLARQFVRDYLLISAIPLSLLLLTMIGFALFFVNYSAGLVQGITQDLNDEAEQSLRQLGEQAIETQARSVANQLAVYLQAHPEATIDQLQLSQDFQSIAVQPVGETGYTAVYDSAGIVHFHANLKIVGQDMHDLADKLPHFWAIYEASLPGTVARGYYEWQEADGTIRDKYMVCVPVGETQLRVAATTYIDEFSLPVVSMRERAELILDRYQAFISRLWIIVGGISGAGLLLVLAGVYALGRRAARRYIRPIAELAEAAERLAAGQAFSPPSSILNRQDEIGALAASFTNLIGQLRHTLAGLEQRSRALTLSAEVSRRMSTILDQAQLMSQVVEQVRSTFDYYHVHIYLLDQAQEQLVVVAGTGEAGEAMEAEGHHIALDASSSLVAQAARTGQVVWVDNVLLAEGWLPNPLLPDTHAEMAVPILLEGQVVGVLDVQEDEIAGLGEGDAELLRSLANQVAVAMRNARLFTEVETALAEAQAVQERYLEEAWQQTAETMRTNQYRYDRPDALALAESALRAARERVLAQNRPAIVAVDGDELGNPVKSIVAPITVRDKAIGAVQLHPASADQTWTEDDLAVVEAVIDQVAQTAENLRLFEETRERAGRERTIREITDRLRTAPTIERLLEIATTELGRRFSAVHAELDLGISVEETENNGQS